MVSLLCHRQFKELNHGVAFSPFLRSHAEHNVGRLGQQAIASAEQQPLWGLKSLRTRFRTERGWTMKSHPRPQKLSGITPGLEP